MLDLANYLPYLLNRSGSRIAASFTQVVRRHGITLSAWRVLAALHYQDGQRIGQLAAMTSIEISTLSRVLDQMQAKALIERRRPEGDARSVAAHLTEAGHAMTLAIIPTAQAYERIALEGFSAEEGKVLREMLVRLYDNMARLEAEPDEEGVPAAATAGI